VVDAAKNVVMLDLAILNPEAAADMFKKPIEIPAKEVRYDPLKYITAAHLELTGNCYWLLDGVTNDTSLPRAFLSAQSRPRASEARQEQHNVSRSIRLSKDRHRCPPAAGAS
jgi:hypothetical protein